MENFDHIDEIIRQKFENFEPEPPLQVWENVRSKISQNPPPSPTGLMLPILFIATFLIIITGLVLNFFNNSQTDPGFSSNEELQLKTAGMISTGSTTTSDHSLQEAIYQNFQENQLEEVLANTPAPPATLPADDAIRVKAPFQPVRTTTQSPIKDNQKPSAAPPHSAERSNWTPGLRQALAAGEISYSDAVKYHLTKKDVRKLSGYQDYARNSMASWSIGVFFNPEVTNHQSDDLENTISYSIGVMPKLSIRHFFIQGGVNARFTHDKGKSAIDYNRFLGTYEDVYLVTFDSTENGVIPTYHTETVEVYDTVDHYAITETKADYTYLEVPLMFGYQMDFGKISLFAKAGPAASFLVSQNIPEVDNPEEKARIVNVDYQVPARYQVNWQLMVGAGLGYKLSDRISFSLEPTFRYALKSEYNLPEDARAKANSFGIRAGLNYNF